VDKVISLKKSLRDSFRFDNIEYAKEVLNSYRNIVPIKNYIDQDTFTSVKHILAAKCESAGFIVGGDLI